MLFAKRFGCMPRFATASRSDATATMPQASTFAKATADKQEARGSSTFAKASSIFVPTTSVFCTRPPGIDSPGPHGAKRQAGSAEHFRQPHSKRRRRAGGGLPPHEREREADRRFGAENAVFRAQKTEERRSAPPCTQKNGVVDETRTRDLLGHNQAL